jgi:anti-sigma factor RsiW
MTANHHDQPELRCRDAEGLIVRAADGSALTSGEQAQLARHLESCAACRAELEDQRHVAHLIQSRPATPIPPAFPAHLAARLGRDARGGDGLLALANWRAWTVGLLPVAGALVLMAYFGVGAGSADASVTTSESSLASAYAATTPAGMFLQPASSGEGLLEAVLTGAVPGEANVR